MDTCKSPKCNNQSGPWRQNWRFDAVSSINQAKINNEKCKSFVLNVLKHLKTPFYDACFISNPANIITHLDYNWSINLKLVVGVKKTFLSLLGVDGITTIILPKLYLEARQEQTFRTPLIIRVCMKNYDVNVLFLCVRLCKKQTVWQTFLELKLYFERFFFLWLDLWLDPARRIQPVTKVTCMYKA